MIDLDAIKAKALAFPPYDWEDDVASLIAEAERLRRIEAAARAHLKEWESGDTMAHDTRTALKQALEGE